MGYLPTRGGGASIRGARDLLASGDEKDRKKRGGRRSPPRGPGAMGSRVFREGGTPVKRER